MRLNTSENPNSTTAYLTLDLIRLILIEELGLDSDRVVIYNQKFRIPPKAGLFIYIEYKGSPKVISSRNLMVPTIDGANEEQDSNMLEDISIGLYSRNLDALQRKEEAVMALHSIYSQQIQEANSFKIFRNVNIIPVNEVEGTARLYRFDLEVKVMSWYNKVKVAQFLDSHSVEVRVNDGQPDLDVVFVIPSKDPTVYPQT